MHDAPYRLIPLRARDGSLRAEVVVDAADYDWLSQWRWQLGNHGYAKRNTTRSQGGRLIYGVFLMHREILGLKKGDPLQGDHINGIRLDNRRANLRAGTIAQQRQNQRSQAGRTSSYRGVSWDKRIGCWIAHVGLSGQIHHLGCFAVEADAAEAAAAWRREHMPYATD